MVDIHSCCLKIRKVNKESIHIWPLIGYAKIRWKHWFSVTITFRFSFHNGLFFSKRNFLSLDLKKAPLWPFIVRNLVNSIRTVESADMLNEKLNRTFEIAYNKNFYVHWQSECFQLCAISCLIRNFGQFSKIKCRPKIRRFHGNFTNSVT